ncbi:AP-2 complex subunit mu [Babesia sp. Xinjiang]|uniref:AP-2 complex subunit mu n=1 Tax=Babesia sp. Xinjiang TaxID=462227 RepID=UPI000A24B6AA|nr:AP-2 complex subunit mu [Babesia sp. Xinjiang]ORM39389.1 AP-2 complex subunit mu [Babesia sp. Xinjiang]
MISSVFITNHGVPLLFRAYSGQSTRQDAVMYAKNMLHRSLWPYKPVQQFAFTTYCSVALDKFHIVAACNGNFNVTLVVQCLNDIRNAIITLLDSNITDATLLDNATMLHELLDLAIDAGYPQDFYLEYLSLVLTKETTSSIFKKNTTGFVSYMRKYGVNYQKFTKGKKLCSVSDDLGPSSNTELQVIKTKVPWRPSTLTTKKNYVFLLLSECINCCYSHAGELLETEITGSMLMDCQVSGEPTLEIKLNAEFSELITRKTFKYLDNNSESDFRPPNGAKFSTSFLDFKVDKTVNINSMLDRKIITMIPPQGVTMLMIYRCDNKGGLPFDITPVLTRATKQLVYYHVTIETKFDKRIHANNVALTIPLPENTANVEMINHAGPYQYKPAQNVMYWHPGKVYGKHILTLEFQCKIAKSINECRTALDPMQLEFELPNYSSSGLYIRDVTLINSTHKTNRDVLYNTANGKYYYKLKLPN